MSKLTTHVLDVSAGIPAAGVRIELRSLQAAGAQLLVVQHTGEDGRCRQPLLEAERFQLGRYSLTFYVGEYFRGRGACLPEPAFIDEAVIHFGIAHADQHYHVPLLVTPWSYSVYRGG
jgi:5-hydroxyisourate hydrolase